MGLAPDSVVSYLRESTRCWLYGFHGASVALSRACLEETLKNQLRASGALDYLNKLARTRGLLDDCMFDMAEKIRVTGNKFLHERGSMTETDSIKTLDAIPSIVEQVFSV